MKDDELTLNTKPIKNAASALRSQAKKSGAVKTIIHRVKADPKLQEKTVTLNGSVTPDAGYDGLSKVNVNVGGGINVTYYAWKDSDNNSYYFLENETPQVGDFAIRVLSKYTCNTVKDIPLLCSKDGSTLLRIYVKEVNGDSITGVLFPYANSEEEYINSPETYDTVTITKDSSNNINGIIQGFNYFGRNSSESPQTLIFSERTLVENKNCYLFGLFGGGMYGSCKMSEYRIKEIDVEDEEEQFSYISPSETLVLSETSSSYDSDDDYGEDLLAITKKPLLAFVLE